MVVASGSMALVAVFEKNKEISMSDLMKVAAEYDVAGRIMARGFVDEFDKLAESLTSGYGIGRSTGGRGFAGPKTQRVSSKQEEMIGGPGRKIPRKASMGDRLMAPSFDSSPTPKSNVTVGKAIRLGSSGLRASSRKSIRNR